jgi:hypothetical protein
MEKFEIHHVDGLENRPIKSVLAAPRKGPPTMPDRPFLGVVCGSRGSGKSSSIINLVKMYAAHHFFDKVILLSPTYHNDPKLATLENDERYELTVHTDVTHELMDTIFDGIAADIEEYKAFQDYLALWKRMARAKDLDAFLRRIDPADVALLQYHQYLPPETRFQHGMPTTLLLCDDLVGCRAIYNNPAVVRFAFRHRHLLTSMLFATQVWRGAVPRGIRNNLSLAILFSNKSKEIRKEIAGELCAYITADQLESIWDHCCQEPHEFMMINFDDPKYRFRRNFNDIVILPKK